MCIKFDGYAQGKTWVGYRDGVRVIVSLDAIIGTPIGVIAIRSFCSGFRIIIVAISFATAVDLAPESAPPNDSSSELAYSLSPAYGVN